MTVTTIYIGTLADGATLSAIETGDGRVYLDSGTPHTSMEVPREQAVILAASILARLEPLALNPDWLAMAAAEDARAAAALPRQEAVVEQGAVQITDRRAGSRFISLDAVGPPAS